MNFVHNDSYVQGYEVYLKVSTQRKADISCLEQRIPAELLKLQVGKDKPRFNILSIGAGDGFMDQIILKSVQEGYLNTHKQLQEVKILNTAVEPNIDYYGQYKDSIEERSQVKTKASSKEESVEFDLKQMSFEEYAESKHDQNQYDMIHAIHILYYVDDLESTLKHCYDNELAENGLIVCLIGTLTSHQSILVRKLLKKFHPEFQEKLTNYTAEDVIRVAEKNSMKYEKVAVPFSVDVTSVFDESSEDGLHLLDFITLGDNYRQTADKHELKEVMKKLQELSTEDDNGRLIVNRTNELILIYKETPSGT